MCACYSGINQNINEKRQKSPAPFGAEAIIINLRKLLIELTESAEPLVSAVPELVRRQLREPVEVGGKSLADVVAHTVEMLEILGNDTVGDLEIDHIVSRDMQRVRRVRDPSRVLPED